MAIKSSLDVNDHSTRVMSQVRLAGIFIPKNSAKQRFGSANIKTCTKGKFQVMAERQMKILQRYTNNAEDSFPIYQSEVPAFVFKTGTNLCRPLYAADLKTILSIQKNIILPAMTNLKTKDNNFSSLIPIKCKVSLPGLDASVDEVVEDYCSPCGVVDLLDT